MPKGAKPIPFAILFAVLLSGCATQQDFKWVTENTDSYISELNRSIAKANTGYPKTRELESGKRHVLQGKLPLATDMTPSLDGKKLRVKFDNGTTLTVIHDDWDWLYRFTMSVTYLSEPKKNPEEGFGATSYAELQVFIIRRR